MLQHDRGRARLRRTKIPKLLTKMSVNRSGAYTHTHLLKTVSELFRWQCECQLYGIRKLLLHILWLILSHSHDNMR